MSVDSGSKPVYLVAVKRFWPETYTRASPMFSRDMERREPSEYPISRFFRRKYDASSTKMLDFLLLPLSLKVVRGIVLLVPSPFHAFSTRVLRLNGRVS